MFTRKFSNLSAAFLGAIVLGSIVVGCGDSQKVADSKTSPATSNDTGPKKSPDASTTAASSTGLSDPSKPSQAENDKPGLPVDQVPKSLRTDAYEYFGLANMKAQDFEILSEGDPTRTGTQQLKLTEVKGDRAVFRVTRTGGLAPSGENDYSLRPDGVWSENSTLDPSMKPSVEIPNDLKPGKSWKTVIEVNTSSDKIKQDMTFKVVGVETVKTPLATREALYIKGEGSAEMGGKKSSMTLKSWYTKGIGMIKMEVASKGTDGKVKTIIIQERKP